MPRIPVAPVLESEPVCPGDTNGGGRRGPDVPNEVGHDVMEGEPKRWATPPSAYRLITLLAMIWIATLFATLTIVLRSRWAHSPSWVSIKLPYILYVDTGILALSSATIELARQSLRATRSQGCTRWMFVSLWMGLLFLVGQAFAWRALSLGGLHLASNPGAFFLYLMTGAHGLYLLGGMALLAYLCFRIRRAGQTASWEVAMGSLALYWHFIDALWLYVVVLLFFTIQR
jgi:cytochrome c oxidase subunit III